MAWMSADSERWRRAGLVRVALPGDGFQGASYVVGRSGMAGATEVGRGDLRQDRRVPGETFAEVGVEINEAWAGRGRGRGWNIAHGRGMGSGG